MKLINFIINSISIRHYVYAITQTLTLLFIDDIGLKTTILFLIINTVIYILYIRIFIFYKA